jgi:hypothetical protein
MTSAITNLLAILIPAALIALLCNPVARYHSVGKLVRGKR